MNKFKKSIAQMTVALFMVAMIAVPSANALTSSDIELLIAIGVIPADKADAARAILNQDQPVSCGLYLRDLTLGSTGSDVVQLQTFLQGKGHLIMPVGVSKGYFGPLTRSALARYQASVGVAPAVGYFGPLTRAKIASDCTPVNPNPTPNNPDLSGDEASLRDYDRKSTYNNESLEEGETAKVFAAEFEVEDGDVKIDRVDVAIEAVSETNEDEPWKQIESIALFINGEEVDSMDVDNKDDWSRESSTENPTASRSYEARFSNLNEKINEGEDVTIEIEITASDSIDDSDLTQSWKVWIPTDGIRAVDGKGIDHYEGDNSESTEFQIEVADSGDVSIRQSDDDLDSAILIVDTDSKSSEHEVFRFEIDSDDADVLLNTLTIVGQTSDNDIDNVISELYVEIDGDEYQYDTASTTGSLGEYTFDFEDNGDEIVIEDNGTIEIVVLAVFNKSNANYADGTTVQFGVGKINGSNYGSVAVTAEGEATGDDADVTGRQEGSVHTLRTEGVSTQSNSAGKFSYQSNTNTTLSDDEGVYTFEIRVTALEEDAWIADSVSTTSSTTVGFVTEITGDAFSGIARARISDSSSDTKTDGRYKVSEGTTETFEIVVELNPDNAGAYGLTLESMNFASTSSGTQVEYVFPDTSEFRISTRTIQN